MKRKPKQLCEYCGNEFITVKKHYPYCSSRQNVMKQQEDREYNQTQNRTQQQTLEIARADQTFRVKDSMIALAESVAKLNQAFAQVIGEGFGR